MRNGMPLCPDFSAVRGRHILIALSGGADSVALAHLLARAREDCALTLSAAHLDHGIRPDSAADAEWCRELCERLGIPFHTARIDVPAEARRSAEGLETAARRLRYAWLRGVMETIGADRIALAHHMDDQAETVLMHLARGTGPEGIGGMPENSGALYRPLLGVRKRDLKAYLREIGADWREDATNAGDHTPRNALRLHAIPELEKSYPQIVPAIARYARAAQIESDFIEARAAEYISKNLSVGPYGMHLRIPDGLHPALLRRAVRRLCGGDLSAQQLEAVAALADLTRGKTAVRGDLTAERGRSGLYFLQGPPKTIPEAPLLLEGVTRLGELCDVTAGPHPAVPIQDDPFRQVLRRDALEGAVLRTRRDGDRIRPLGCGEKLLSDYLIDRRVDRPLRDCLALVARGGEVLWVCGLGIAEPAALRPGCKEAVRLECRYAFDTRPFALQM